MEKYKEGSVFELYENDNSEFIILKKAEIENNIYLLISQLYGTKNNLGINSRDMLLIQVDKNTDAMELVDNKQIIRAVIDYALAG